MNAPQVPAVRIYPGELADWRAATPADVGREMPVRYCLGYGLGWQYADAVAEFKSTGYVSVILPDGSRDAVLAACVQVCD